MGGYGSGRWHRLGAKRTTDVSCPLDVCDLRRRGLLEPGGWFHVRWWRGDNEAQANSIQGEVFAGYVQLVYRYLPNRGKGVEVRQHVSLEWTPCHYGGHRPWWRCPKCGRRCRVLHAPLKEYACQKCSDLAYSSQREHPVVRTRERARNVRMRLGGSASMLEPFPERPKGMHWRTYWRLSVLGQRLDLESWQTLEREYACMDRRLEGILARSGCRSRTIDQLEAEGGHLLAPSP